MLNRLKPPLSCGAPASRAFGRELVTSCVYGDQAKRQVHGYFQHFGTPTFLMIPFPWFLFGAKWFSSIQSMGEFNRNPVAHGDPFGKTP